MISDLYRAVLGYLAIAAILIAALFFGLGFWGRAASDARADSLAVHGKQLRGLADATAAELTIVLEENEKLKHAVGIDSAQHAIARRALRSHFSIDSVPHLPAVALTPAHEDTTQFYDLVRFADSTHFPVPLEFMTRVRAELVAADSAYHSEHLVRVYQDNYVIPLKDTLITQLHQLADTNHAAAEYWKGKATHPRCGTKCKMISGAALFEGARRLARALVHG